MVATSFILQNEPVTVGTSTLIERPSDFGKRPEDQVAYWLAQDKIAEEKERQWMSRSRKIVDRYRDKRPDNLGDLHRYNVLWSNVQTLKPALYARTPKPDVERRFKDEDPVGRTAATILERALTNSMDGCNFDRQMQASLEDLLLPGRGVCRVLYVPHFGDPIPQGDDQDDNSGAPKNVDGDGPPKEEVPDREVVFEEAKLTYIFWEDYREGPARKWEDVPWIRYRAYLTRDELIERFKAKGKLIKLDSTPHNERSGMENITKDSQVVSIFQKAEIWEIWDRMQKRVIWLAPTSAELGFLDALDDPLGLPEFFPNPDPLLATTTNDQRIPVPDYVEYQDQADELDLITQRIDILLKALRVIGIYAGEEKQVIAQIFQGTDNRMIPVEDFASFMTDKGGLSKLIEWVPIQQVAEVLIQLYNARDRVKQVLYEITGMSDIMRGASSPVETATAQQIKVQFGNMRLSDRQRQIAKFACECIRLMAHVIAKQFSPQTIAAMTGYPQLQPVPLMPQGLQPMVPDPQSGQMVPNPQLQQYMMQAQPIIQANQQKQQEFEQACQLLKDDMPHGFRIDIEADSTIMPDEQQEKQSRVEFMQAFTPFMQQALMASTQMPPFAPVAKEMTLFFMRGFKVARPLEESVEKLFDNLERQPPPPPPGQEQGAQGDPHAAAAQMQGNQIKAQVDAQGNQLKAQTEQQNAQLQAQTDSQATQADASTKLQIAQMQQQSTNQNNQATLALKAAQMQQDAQFKSADLVLKQQDQEMKAQALQARETKMAAAEAKGLQ